MGFLSLPLCGESKSLKVSSDEAELPRGFLSTMLISPVCSPKQPEGAEPGVAQPGVASQSFQNPAQPRRGLTGSYDLVVCYVSNFIPGLLPSAHSCQPTWPSFSSLNSPRSPSHQGCCTHCHQLCDLVWPWPFLYILCRKSTLKFTTHREAFLDQPV